MRRLLALVLLLCLPAHAASARDEGPVAYSRTNIVIMHAADADKPPPMPWQTQATGAGTSGIAIEVEIRDASVLYNDSGWYNLSGLSDKSGVMMVFEHASIAPITRSSQYVPLDVLMIDEEGDIDQIVPNLMMSQLAEDIVPEKPVKAFLFMPGGECQAMNIQPGDRVLYKLFRRPPRVLGSQPQPTAQKLPDAQPKADGPKAEAGKPEAAPENPPIPAETKAEMAEEVKEQVTGPPDKAQQRKRPALQDTPIQQKKPRGSGVLMIPVIN